MNNLGNSPEENSVNINDLVIEELVVDGAPPIPASAELGAKDLTSYFKENVQATTQVENSDIPNIKKLEPHDTFDLPDAELKKPYSTLNQTPEGMHIKSGNEDGAAMMITEKVNIAGFTDTGVDKEKNDDGVLISGPKMTAAVTDGVGGNSHGETASNVTLHTLARMLEDDKDFNLKDAPNLANIAVKEFHDHNEEEYEKCSATFAAVQITPEGLAKMVHVGDAKVLMIRDGEIHYESVDDNLLEVIKANMGVDDKGAQDYLFNKYKKDARPDALVQSIGAKGQVVNFKDKSGNTKTSKVLINHHYHEVQTQSGDVFIVLTDGLRSLDSEEIKDIVSEGLKAGKEVNVVLSDLRKEAKNRMNAGTGDKDNLSSAIIEVK